MAFRQGPFDRFNALGERLQTGPLEQIEALGPHRHVTLAQPAETALCVGWRPTMSAEEIRSQMKKDKMTTLQQDGLRLVAEGKTSLEELQRVFKPA